VGCFDNIAVKFYEATAGENVAERMQCPFDEI
jgi:hypothetical protein